MHIRDTIYGIEAISSHEHVGSMSPAGFYSSDTVGQEAGGLKGFLADIYPGCETSTVTLFDLILSPYFSGLLYNLGYNFDMHKESCNGYFAMTEVEQCILWEGLTQWLQRSRGTGLYMALDRALIELYGISLGSLLKGEKSWQKLSEDIGIKYKTGLYEWSKCVLKEAKIRYAVKPVHLMYLELIKKQLGNERYNGEKNCFLPILRVDDLMGYMTPESICCWSHLEKVFPDIKVKSLDDIDAIVEKSFDLVNITGVRGIKQLQAYYRTLDFKWVNRDSAVIAFKALLEKNDLPAKLAVQDYIMDCILQKASSMKLPYQIHTGMANLPDSNPVLLREVVERYNNVNFVLLHCYPYISEAAFMARTYRNVYLDTAWLALQSPALLYKALYEWIGFVPYTKICISGDATSPEECYGAMQITRDVLSEVLVDKIAKGELDYELAIAIAQHLLHENSAYLYGRDI